MKIKVSCSKVYDTDDLMPEFLEWQDDHLLTFSALEDFILDRFIAPNFDSCDVLMEIQHDS